MRASRSIFGVRDVRAAIAAQFRIQIVGHNEQNVAPRRRYALTGELVGGSGLR